MTWQDRETAPFAQEVWDQIDAVARAAADEVRAARRLVEVVGPLGFAARAGGASRRAAAIMAAAHPRSTDLAVMALRPPVTGLG